MNLSKPTKLKDAICNSFLVKMNKNVFLKTYADLQIYA